MSKEKTFLLCLLKITDAIIERFHKEPEKIHQQSGIVPDNYNRVQSHKVSPGMTVYTLRDHPRFEGVVHDVIADDNGHLIEFVDGHTRYVRSGETVYTCVGCDKAPAVQPLQQAKV